MRIWNDNGNIYIARGRLKPQHLVLNGENVVWVIHSEGGICKPFCEVPAQRQKTRGSRMLSNFVAERDDGRPD